jgi:hypothetical protein
LQQQLQPTPAQLQRAALQVGQLGSGSGPPSAERRGLAPSGVSDRPSTSIATVPLSSASRNAFAGSAHAGPVQSTGLLSTVPMAVAACIVADPTGSRFAFGGSGAAGADPVVGVAAGWLPEANGLHHTSPAYLAPHGRGLGAALHGRAPSYAAAAEHALHRNLAAGPGAGAHFHLQGLATAGYEEPSSAHAVAASSSSAAAPFPSAFALVSGAERGRISASDRSCRAHSERSVSTEKLSAGTTKPQAVFGLDGPGAHPRPCPEAGGGLSGPRGALPSTRRHDPGSTSTGIQHKDFSLSPPLERAVLTASQSGAMPLVDIGRSAPEAYGFAVLHRGQQRQIAESAAAAAGASHAGAAPLPAQPSGRELQRAAHTSTRLIQAAPPLSESQAIASGGVFSPALALNAASGSAASVSQASIVSSAAGSTMATDSIASAAGSTAAYRHGHGGQDRTGRVITPNIDADTYSSASRTSASSSTSVPSQPSGSTHGQRTGQSRGTATTAGEASLGGFSADAFLVGSSESSHNSSRAASPVTAHNHAGAAPLLHASADQPPVRARPLAPHSGRGDAGHAGQPTTAGGAPSVVSHLRSQVADIHISHGAFDARPRDEPPPHLQLRQPRSHEQQSHPGSSASHLQRGAVWEPVLGASTGAAAAVPARDDEGLHRQLLPLCQSAALNGLGRAGHQLAMAPQRPLLPSGDADGTAPPYSAGVSDGPALPAFPPIDDSLFADAEEL